MANKFDPILGEYRQKDGIPQYSTDPVSPVANDAWVTRTSVYSDGSPMGLLLAITDRVLTGYTYVFKYRTEEATTVAVSLT